MTAWSAITRRANQATAGELAVSVLPMRIICDRNFSFSVKTTSDLHDDERTQIWRLFEENMYELYQSSSFGWDPSKKKAEMFGQRSRFVIVRDISDPTNELATFGMIAYSIIRFEREERQNVVYCYELQVAMQYRRSGLGRLLTQVLSDIGAQWCMTKIMLTVFKANHTALLFYRSIGFTIDDSSPEFCKEDEYDYCILSRPIP